MDIIQKIEQGLPFSMSIGKIYHPRSQAGRRFIKTHARIAAHADLPEQKSSCNFIETGPEHWDIIYMTDEATGKSLQLSVYKEGTMIIDVDYKSTVQEASLKVLGFADDVVAVLKKLVKEAEEEEER